MTDAPTPLHESLVISATHYSLPQATDAADRCIDYLILHWPNFTLKTRAMLEYEIEEALTNGRVPDAKKHQWLSLMARHWQSLIEPDRSEREKPSPSTTPD